MTAHPDPKRYVVRVKLRRGVREHPNLAELAVLTKSLGDLWTAIERSERGAGAGSESSSATPPANAEYQS